MSETTTEDLACLRPKWVCDVLECEKVGTVTTWLAGEPHWVCASCRDQIEGRATPPPVATNATPATDGQP